MLVLLVDRYPAMEALNFALVDQATCGSVAVLCAAVDGETAHLMSWMRQPGQQDILPRFDEVEAHLYADGVRILRGSLQPPLARYVCRRAGFHPTGEHRLTRVGALSVVEKRL